MLATTQRLDDAPAAATTIYRKRAVFYNALGYAVERKLLPTNPIDQVQWSAPEVAESVHRRVVASPAQVKQILRQFARKGTAAPICLPTSPFFTMPGSGRPKRSPCGAITVFCLSRDGVAWI